MLLDHAAENQVEVCQGVNVKDVVFEDDCARAVEIESEDGGRARVDARVIVDCSGQTALIARKLKLKHVFPKIFLFHIAFHNLMEQYHLNSF